MSIRSCMWISNMPLLQLAPLCHHGFRSRPWFCQLLIFVQLSLSQNWFRNRVDSVYRNFTNATDEWCATQYRIVLKTQHYFDLLNLPFYGHVNMACFILPDGLNPLNRGHCSHTRFNFLFKFGVIWEEMENCYSQSDLVRRLLCQQPRKVKESREVERPSTWPIDVSGRVNSHLSVWKIESRSKLIRWE